MENYQFKYRSRGKIIYVPNERCKRKGKRILDFFSRRLDFPDYFYHYKPGGHIAALHAHLEHKFFFKIDIKNFFYSIARMRVTRALRHWGYPGANTLAKWSCVLNPLPGPKHVLPIGFIQSPLLASLVLIRSEVAQAIERAKDNGVCISVYLDDFIGSHDDEATLRVAYENIRETCVKALLVPNADKLVPPTTAIVAFNCDLTQGIVRVRDERVARFLSAVRAPASIAAFEQYQESVASKNVAAS